MRLPRCSRAVIGEFYFQYRQTTRFNGNQNRAPEREDFIRNEHKRHSGLKRQAIADFFACRRQGFANVADRVVARPLLL